MSTPGLTAEASLYKTSRVYHGYSALTGAAEFGGVVHAQLYGGIHPQNSAHLSLTAAQPRGQSTGFAPAWAQSLGQLGQVVPFAGNPCGTCGPCTQDET